jgi:hypothetical protein
MKRTPVVPRLISGNNTLTHAAKHLLPDQRRSEAIRGNQLAPISPRHPSINSIGSNPASRRSYLMMEAIRGHQRSSEVLRGHQVLLVPDERGNQRPSRVAIRGNQRQSEAIRGNQWQSVAIRGHQRE